MAKLWSNFYHRLSNVFSRLTGPSPNTRLCPTYKGTDLDGNHYFEYTDGYGVVHRKLEPPEMEKILKSDPVSMKMAMSEIKPTAEWISWLRQHRDEVPTDEEVLQNLAIAYLKRNRAKELEAEERKNWPELDAALSEIEKEKYFIGSFPKFVDLERNPAHLDYYPTGFYRNELKGMDPILQHQIAAKDDELDKIESTINSVEAADQQKLLLERRKLLNKRN